MKLIKEFEVQEYKDKIVITLGFAIFIILLYLLFYKPIINWYEKKEEYREYSLKSMKESKIFEAGEQRYKRLEEELLNEEKENKETLKELENKSFKNIVAFEKYVDDIAEKNSILIETIGRIERVVETDKSYIPYIVSGEIDDINRFVKELEEGEQKISFSETTSQLDITQSKGRLTCKLSANILEKIEEDKEKVEELNFKKILGYGVKDIKFLKYNEKEYIIIKYRDGSKDIYFQGEILDIDGIKYEIFIKNREIYLKYLKN